MFTDAARIYLLSLAFIAYLAADQIGGNGFIAAFTTGVATGNALKLVNEEIYEFAESEGQLLNLVIFFLFGVALLPLVWGLVSWTVVAYALLSLTLVRIIPVLLALIGKKLRWETTLFLCWFGPRGLASILFVLLVLDHAQLTHESLVFDTVTVTVALSVLLHGLTALPGVNAYAAALRICARRGDDLTASKPPWLRCRYGCPRVLSRKTIPPMISAIESWLPPLLFVSAPAQKVHFVTVIFNQITDTVERDYFNTIPTTLALPNGDIDAIRTLAGRLLDG